MQHLVAFMLLIPPLYSIILALTTLLAVFGRKILPVTALRAVMVPLLAAILFIFADNLLRAAAALMALDEQVRVRRFMWFRVFWKLVRMVPLLFRTQVNALFFFGPGYVIGDCLWPVICVVEKLSGRAAVERSRELMDGLRSAGRSLAIRHLALATFAVADAITSLSFLLKSANHGDTDVVATAVWFPIFALFAAAPLFLYDRTAANQSGPLLQLDRTPEVRITSRALSVASMVWLGAMILYILWQPAKKWFGLH